MRLSDLPQSEKYALFHILVVPDIDGQNIKGRLYRLSDSDHAELTRDVQVLFNKEVPGLIIGQDGIQLNLDVKYTSVQEEIPCHPNARFMFESAAGLVMVGRVISRLLKKAS